MNSIADEVNEEQIRSHLAEVVRGTVEETLNAQAHRHPYERSLHIEGEYHAVIHSSRGYTAILKPEERGRRNVFSG